MHINYSGQGRPQSENLGSRFTALKPALVAPSTPQQSQGPRQSQEPLPGTASALSTADMAEMLKLIQKVSAQVDELTMRVARQSEK